MLVFVTGGTGYIGSRLIPALLARGHRVAALSRPGSARTLAPGCRVVVGDALDASSYTPEVGAADALVHLVGVAHPNPRKAAEFVSVDLASARAALTAATAAGVQHLLYVSVAQPAPIMRAYVVARSEAERLIAAAGIAASILRPWYVLGPGHHWPLLLLPAYYLLERLPATQAAAQRFGLLGVEQMVRAMVCALEAPPTGIRIWGVPEIRSAAA